MPKKLRTTKRVDPASRWENLAWKPVDTAGQDLGKFEECAFFGLEEVDASAYLIKKEGAGLSVVNTASERIVVNANDVQELTAEDTSKTTTAKKGKKRTLAGEEASGTKEVTNTAATSEATSKKKKKKQKDKAGAEGASSTTTNDTSSTAVSKKAKKAATQAKTKTKTGDLSNEVVKYIANGTALDTWGKVELNGLLKLSLKRLGFEMPTPIQTSAIPLTLEGGCDIVGAAETGSGKTMSFGLPIINSLLLQWETYCNSRSPFALIVAPTRELAMQISTVLRDISVKCMKEAKLLYCKENGLHESTANKISDNGLRVEVITIIGGMSEHKQRRQLSNENKKPIHIIIATPGRLLDIFKDETIEVFQDMSTLRFLVVDEADRIMEEGHFAELHRVFQRIRDHEEIRVKGGIPNEVTKARKLGTTTYDDGYAEGLQQLKEEHQREKERQIAAIEAAAGSDAELEEDLFDPNDEDMMDPNDMEFPTMPTEEELAAARKDDSYLLDTRRQVSKWERSGDASVKAKDEGNYEEDDNDNDHDEGDGKNEDEDVLGAQRIVLPFSASRQTLLYSATAIQSQFSKQTSKSNKNVKKLKLNGTLKGVGESGVLPDNLKQLLSIVAIQKSIHVVDVTGDRGRKIAADSAAAAAAGSDGATSAGTTSSSSSSAAAVIDHSGIGALPKGLVHKEIRVPVEDKDAFLYYYLYTYPGRVLLFVNSIKTARRVDGLLRALELPSRTIHAQLQQRQRLRALEGFQVTPVGILVATDVAARGLDVSNIQTVIHYDVARSPQVYVHRSGRTARANTTGTTISLVAPEDSDHHHQICEHVKLNERNTMPTLKVDLSIMPALRERVKLAKEIFTKSFVVSQTSSEKQWVKRNADEMGLELDDYTRDEFGDDEAQQAQERAAKNKVLKSRAKLKHMLDTSLHSAQSMNRMVPSRVKPGKKPRMVSESQANRRKGGLFVYAK